MLDTKIPFLNQKFIFSTFLTIVRKSFWIILCIIIASLLFGFLYHRYTRPEYKAQTVIQIKTENKTNKILNLNSGIVEADIAPVIELIRSNEFIRTVVEVLPLNISYNNQGAILFSELYRNSPFEVGYHLSNPLLLDQKINCEFVKPEKCLLSYQIGNANYEYRIDINKWDSVFGMEVMVNVDPARINDLYNKQYFFVINNERTIIKNITSNLNVQVLSESAGTILVTYTDNNAYKSAEIANTIAEKLLEFDENKKKEGAKNVLNYIDAQMENILDNLNKTERDLHNFRLENNIMITDVNILSNKNQILTSQISELEAKMLSIDFEIITLEEVVKLLNNREIRIYEILAILSGKESGNSLAGLINSISELVDRREILLFDITENTNKIRIIDEQIETRKRTIIDFINSTKIRLKSEKEELSKRIKELESLAFTVNDYDQIEYARLNRLYNINQDYYSQLMKAKAETMVSQAGYVSNNIILEKAVIPNKPSYPDLTLVLIVSFIVSIIISIIYLFIKYLFYNKILTVSDIIEYTQIPVFGSIPRVKSDMPISKPIIHLRPKSILTEAFRNIRSKIEFYPISGKCRIITISSTIAGEGKTFVGLNIADMYAMSDKKTIILDFDLRKPRLHKCFNVENIKGISTILINRHTYQECIHHSDIENLDFITSGPIPPNPAEIILNESLNKLISDLKSMYDIIIIDTPPIGIVIDALTTYKLADNALYIMRSEVSIRNYINNINNITANNELKNTAIILNDVKQPTSKYGTSSYRYGYGYSYGYGYGYTKNERSTYYDEESDVETMGLFQRIKNKLKK